MSYDLDGEAEPDKGMFVRTSLDKKVVDELRVDKDALIVAMKEQGAQFIIVEGVPRLFGYHNPTTKVTIDPMQHNDVNVTYIIDTLRREFPNETLTSILWDLKYLFQDMPSVCRTVSSEEFNPMNDSKFPVTSNMDGIATNHYNMYNPEFRPITNTIVESGEYDKLVANVLFKAVEASAESIADHSAIDNNDKPELLAQIKTTISSYVQAAHYRMRYAMVILGKQGSGKSILANLVANAGGYSEYISVSKLTGDFGSRWNKACTVVVDEASIANEAQGNQLKNFITADTTDLEEKYKSTVSAKLHMNFIFTTNMIEDFRTFETENRRYFVLTANGTNVTDDHDCITPRVKVTPAEYTALCTIREFGHFNNHESGVKVFVPTEASDKVVDGLHTIVVSQLGALSAKPREFLGVYKVFANMLSDINKGKPHKLEQLANRVLTSGQLELAHNVPKQLRVTSEHNTITGYIRGFGKDTDVSIEIVNEEYVNINKAMKENGVSVVANNVIDYFTAKYVCDGTAWTVTTNKGDSLLIKVSPSKANTSEGKAVAARAIALNNKLRAGSEVIAVESEAVKEVNKELLQKSGIENFRLYLMTKFPDGNGSVSIQDAVEASGMTSTKLQRTVSSIMWLKFSKNQFHYSEL